MCWNILNAMWLIYNHFLFLILYSLSCVWFHFYLVLFTTYISLECINRSRVSPLYAYVIVSKRENSLIRGFNANSILRYSIFEFLQFDPHMEKSTCISLLLFFKTLSACVCVCVYVCVSQFFSFIRNPLQ